MNLFIILAAVVSMTVPAKMPDPKLTPGATDRRVTQKNIQSTICKAGYTKSVRKTPARVIASVFHEYEIPPEDWSGYEMDHLISLELGGADVAKNLWPQPYCPTKAEAAARSKALAMLGMFPPAPEPCYGAREKDVVETAFKRSVCAGKMTLKDAQQRIAKNWYAEYLAIKAGK